MKRWFFIFIYIILFFTVVGVVFVPLIINRSNIVLFPSPVNFEDNLNTLTNEGSKITDIKYIERFVIKINKFIKENCYFKLYNNCKKNKNITDILVQDLDKETKVIKYNTMESNRYICMQCDLRKFNFNEIVLIKSTLHKSNLTSVNFNKKDLNHSNLSFTTLNLANMSETNLYGANLSFSYLISTNLYQANLENSNLMGSNLSNAIMIYSNLKNADLRNANLTDADLTNANVQNLTLNEETIFCRTKWPSGKDSYTEDNSDC